MGTFCRSRMLRPKCHQLFQSLTYTDGPLSNTNTTSLFKLDDLSSANWLTPNSCAWYIYIWAEQDSKKGVLFSQIFSDPALTTALCHWQLKVRNGGTVLASLLSQHEDMVFLFVWRGKETRLSSCLWWGFLKKGSHLASSLQAAEEKRFDNKARLDVKGNHMLSITST